MNKILSVAKNFIHFKEPTQKENVGYFIQTTYAWEYNPNS